MKYGDLVTVGLLAFNQRAFIRAALDGVLAQTYRPLEIVIIDDGSTDGTWEEIEGALGLPHAGSGVRTVVREPGVTIVLNRNERNLGNLGNLVKIGELSHGEWIVKCDGDDISEPRRAERIVGALTRAGDGSSRSDSAPRGGEGDGSSRSDSAPGEVRIVNCGGVKIDVDGKVIGSFKARTARYPLGAGMAFHRDCFDRFPVPANGHLVDDEVFARRALMLGGELCLDAPLIRYRIGSGVSSDVRDPRSVELRCMAQFPESLRQCRADLEYVRADLGEAKYAEWTRRLDAEARHHELDVKLRASASFAERWRAYRALEKPPLWKPYRWKLTAYLLPHRLADVVLGTCQQARYSGRSLGWTGLEKIFVYGINFAQGVVLARLLCPEDFGLAAMLGLFITVGGTLCESGLTGALIVKGYGPRLREIERSAFRWNVGIAAVVYLLFALAAGSVADWYGKPILAPLLCVMAVSLVVHAASAVATARLWRTQRFDRLAGVNGGSTLIGAALAVILAWRGCGVWTIASMCVCHAVIRTLAAWGASRRCVAPIREGEPVSPPFREVLGYGLKLTASSVINTGYIESYNLLIGKVFGPSSVGLFARGERWSRLPGEVSGDVVGRVALPTLTRAKGAGMREALRFVGLHALLLWPGLVVLWIWAEEIVVCVFGAQWAECAPLLRILLLGQFAMPVANVAQNVIRSRGDAGAVLKTDAWKKPIGFAAMFAGLSFGIVGLCWAKVFGDFVGAAVDLVYAVRGAEPANQDRRAVG